MTKPNTHSYVAASGLFFRKQALFLNRPFLSCAKTLLQSKSEKKSYKSIAELHNEENRSILENFIITWSYTPDRPSLRLHHRETNIYFRTF